MRRKIESHLLQLKQVLSAGRALLLLDGLIEVNQDVHDWVLREIGVVFEEFHDNHFDDLPSCDLGIYPLNNY